MKTLDGWAKFWFRPAACFDLALLRVVLVALQCYLLLSYNFPALTYVLSLPDYLYEPQLVLKILALPFGGPVLPDASTMIGLFWITFLLGLLSLVGLFTNVSLALFALFNIVIQAFTYSFGDIHHPEAIMMLALISLAISPSGRVMSLDSWLKRRRNGAVGESKILLDVKDKYSGWPILFLQLFYPLMYLSAVVSKLTRGGLEWANGISLQYYMILEAYKNDSDLALYVSQFHNFLKFSEVIVLIFQATFFLILFFPRLKWIYLPLGLSFHIIIYVTLRAPFPQWIVLYMIYVPWAAVFAWLANHRVPDLSQKTSSSA